MNQGMTISADCLPLPGKSNLTERTAGGKNQIHTTQPPSSPGNHGKAINHKAREYMRKRNLNTPSQMSKRNDSLLVSISSTFCQGKRTTSATLIRKPS